MKWEGSVSNLSEGHGCEHCGETGESTFMQLECGHLFCLKCLAFMYYKFKMILASPMLLRCLLCDQATRIAKSQLELIHQFTEQFLVPLARQQQKSDFPSEPRSPPTNTDAITDKKARPPQSGSRRESPESRPCPMHPPEPLSIVCFTCSHILLCLRCAKTRRHSCHELRSLSRGAEALQEQLEILQLRTKERLEALQLDRRRALERKEQLRVNAAQANQDIRMYFRQLQEALVRKEAQLLEQCKESFDTLGRQAAAKVAELEEVGKSLRRRMNRAGQAVNEGKAYELVEQYCRLVEEGQASWEEDGELRWLSQRLGEEVLGIQAKLSKLQVSFRGGGTKEEQGKRVKTNMLSLNSSRDRKEKKCTKTEEDEKRNKSRANYKTQSSSKLLKVNKSIPNYIFERLQHNQFDGNPLHSSFKSTKLLSKSTIPVHDEPDRKPRRKDTNTLVKQRLQRKTVNTHNYRDARGTETVKRWKMPS